MPGQRNRFEDEDEDYTSTGNWRTSGPRKNNWGLVARTGLRYYEPGDEDDAADDVDELDQLDERLDEPLDEGDEWARVSPTGALDAYGEYDGGDLGDLGDLGAESDEQRALSPLSAERSAYLPALAEWDEPPPAPIIVAGNGVAVSAPIIRRRPRPLVLRLTMILSALCILATGLFLYASWLGDGSAAPLSGRTPTWNTAANAVALGQGGGAAPGVKAPGIAGLTSMRQPQVVKKVTTPAESIISSAPFAPWPPDYPYMAVPGHPSFYMQPVSGFYPYAFGQCTYWASYMRRDENLAGLGDAMYWAVNAAARGYAVGNVPSVGATVVFQPGVQGAGGVGHVGHVEAIYPNGWFLVSEMNFYTGTSAGGGWGMVDYRYAHTGWGVQFIY